MAREGQTPLSELAIGQRAELVEHAVEPRDGAWLAGFGLAIGEHVTVLRRAPFGGPLHVRAQSGVEFAVGADLAAKLLVQRA